MNFVGFGCDAHRFAKGRPLYLGGLKIPFDKGLAGHSDADVLLHAICDAILGSLALGDIGHHFPDSDPRWKDVSSSEMLNEVIKMISIRGGHVVNIDATIVAQEPRISPFVPQMKERIAELVGIPPSRVSIKATTTEGMGFTGASEGIAAFATVLVSTLGTGIT